VFDRSEVNVWREQSSLIAHFSSAVGDKLQQEDHRKRIWGTEFSQEVADYFTFCSGQCREGIRRKAY
jgi:hypothetical protein